MGRVKRKSAIEHVQCIVLYFLKQSNYTANRGPVTANTKLLD